MITFLLRSLPENHNDWASRWCHRGSRKECDLLCSLRVQEKLADYWVELQRPAEFKSYKWTLESDLSDCIKPDLHWIAGGWRQIIDMHSSVSLWNDLRLLDYYRQKWVLGQIATFWSTCNDREMFNVTTCSTEAFQYICCIFHEKLMTNYCFPPRIWKTLWRSVLSGRWHWLYVSRHWKQTCLWCFVQSPDPFLPLKPSTCWRLTFLLGFLPWPAPACWSHAASRAPSSSVVACGRKSMGALFTIMARVTWSTISRAVPKCHRIWAKESVRWRSMTLSLLTAGPSVSTQKRERTSTVSIQAVYLLLWKVSIARQPGLIIPRYSPGRILTN